MRLRCVILFLILSMSFLSYAQVPNAITVVAGEQIELTAPFQIPQGDLEAFDIYMQGLKLAAPLPFPFVLDRYAVQNGKLTVVGRCLRGGMYELPLGVFCCKDQSIVLPAWSLIVQDIAPTVLRARDMLYPYPKSLLRISSYNQRIQESFNQQAFMDAASAALIQWKVACSLAIILFCSATMPLLYVVWQSNRLARSIIMPQKSLTPHDAFLSLKKTYELGDFSWTRLLNFLNEISSPTESQTSYELREMYQKYGDRDLAQVCALIEEHGYLPQSAPYLEETFGILKKRFN